jgi:cyclopropane fatty-acyl-phospholipid synthase-like methyltransferase
VLEIGCGPGNLLAWLIANGVSNVQGLEASREDAEVANERLGGSVVSIGTAIEFLQECSERFDLIILKAVVEHQPKDELIPLMEALVGALEPDGRLVIDVPNMDWITATHERYMDLTHEVGFTRESLSVLLQLWFDDVDIRGSRPGGLRRSRRLARWLGIWIIRAMLFALGEGGSNTLFESRAIIALARQPRGRT